MFIHWGLYALPARHEWIKLIEKMKDEDYQKYFDHFDPDMFDPKAWAKTARETGMKYVVITTKHHEGFCLFDSRYTDYKATNTKAGKDLVREITDAFRAEGLKIGFYYSLIDWHHPEFTVDCAHPLRDGDREALNINRDMKKYTKYMRDQITELLTNYGKIDILWLDNSYKDKGKNEWEAEELIKTARNLVPEIIINNRTQIEQDLWTPEQYQPQEWLRDNDGNLVVWEACHTFSGSWGYYRDEYTWKSPEMLIQMLINTVSIGGNLLLNVGPTARGYFDKRAVNLLSAIGEWMKYNSKSIYGCTQSEFTAPKDVRYTQCGNKLYAHLFVYPFQHLKLPGLAGKIEYAQFLHDASEIKFVDDEQGHVTLTLPAVKPDQIVPVVELFLK